MNLADLALPGCTVLSQLGFLAKNCVLACNLENTFIGQFRLNKSMGSAFPGLSNQFIDLYLAMNSRKSG